MAQLYHTFPQLMKSSQMPGVVHKAGHAYSSGHLMPSLLISCDVPITNIMREPCGGWITVLLMVVSFVIGCVDRMCQSSFQNLSFSS